MQTGETCQRAKDYATSLPPESEARVLGFGAGLDGHNPPRTQGYGHVVGHKLWRKGQSGWGLVIWRTDFDASERMTQDTYKALYLVGARLSVPTPMFVSGMSPTLMPDAVFLQPLVAYGLNPAYGRTFVLALDWIPALADWHRERLGVDRREVLDPWVRA